PVVISRENLQEEDRLRQALGDTFGDTCRLLDGLGAVSVVGAGINASFENVRRGNARLTEAGFAIAGLATSSFRITWMVERARLSDAVRLLHQTFIDKSLG